MDKRSPFAEALERLRDKPIITIGCGTTCGCLGDERSLREFLVADEAARMLREEGHAVVSLLIDDTYDPLTERQLRIAFHKDEAMVEKWSEWCGKPLANVPDPWDCHSSYAAHFENALLDRLQWLGCCPNLISSSYLYQKGVYAPFVQKVLTQYRELSEFIVERFPGYQPQCLYRVLCPACGCIDQTKVIEVGVAALHYECERCGNSGSLAFDEVDGKLNWKLDCAARWDIFQIDAEPFSKAYLEPRTGTFAVAQEISRAFFGARSVVPLRYGLVTIDKSMSHKLLNTMPADVLRDLFVKRPTADIHITSEMALTQASQFHVDHGLSYLDCIKQLVPLWLLRPQALSSRQMELVGGGIAFAETFLDQQISTHLPSRQCIAQADPEILCLLHGLLVDVISLRMGRGVLWDGFLEPAKQLMVSLGDRRQEVTACLRAMLGQKQGPPPSRLLYMLPMEYLQTLEYVLDLHLTLLESQWDSRFVRSLGRAA